MRSYILQLREGAGVAAGGVIVPKTTIVPIKLPAVSLRPTTTTTPMTRTVGTMYRPITLLSPKSQSEVLKTAAASVAARTPTHETRRLAVLGRYRH
jgi:hypothetical protein